MTLRCFLLSSAALTTASVLAATPAHAASTEELEAKIAALEAAVSALKAEVATQKTSSSQQLIVLEQKVDAASAARPVPASGPALGKGFAMGNTTVTIGGIVDLDVNVTDTTDGDIASASIARDFYIPGATPVGGLGEGTPDTDFTAEASRFWIAAETPVADKKLGARVELDFLGSAQGNELATNSYSPRLRHAYFTYGGWMFGQNWSTFQNTSTIPDSASFLALNDGMIFVRQPQIRYTRGPWQVALENPNTREFAGWAVDDSLIPDIVAKYTLSGAWGNASLAGLGRMLREEAVVGGANVKDSAMGWGVSLAGDVKLASNAGVKFSLTGGEGVGRYIGLAAIADTRLNADGDLEPISTMGGLVALYGAFGERLSGTVGYSGLFADAELGETESVQSLLAVLSYKVAPGASVAAELLHGRRAIDALPGIDDEGEITRFTVSTKYAF